LRIDEATLKERLRLYGSKTRCFCPSESKATRIKASLFSPSERNLARSAFFTVFSPYSLRQAEKKGMAITSHLLIFLKFFLVPLSLSLFFTWTSIKISRKFNILVEQKKDRWHKRPISNLGGIGIFLSFLIPFCLYQDEFKNNYYLLLPLFLIFALGLLDDFINLKPYTKLTFQIVVALSLIYQGCFFSVSGSKLLDFVVSLIWILVIINAFNLIDNIDGLSAGIAFICGISLLFFSILQNNSFGAFISLILCAFAFGFLLFNFSPAKIFMGNSGSYFIGTLFSIISIRVFSDYNAQILPLILFLFLIFFVPVFDTLFVFVRRISSHRLFYKGGCDHISHTLVDLGLSERKTVFLLYAVNFTCVVLAFLINFLIYGF
jgi:UDP-GlcNAc:undecaprenyl-phosphate GlcNAc-1-phosphate transferase